MSDRFDYGDVSVEGVSNIQVTFDGDIEATYTEYFDQGGSADREICFEIDEIEKVLEVAKAQRDKYKAYMDNF